MWDVNPVSISNNPSAMRLSCVMCGLPLFVNHLHAVSVSLATATRTPIKTSLTRHLRGPMSGSLSTCPHGDRHSSVKGRPIETVRQSR